MAGHAKTKAERAAKATAASRQTALSGKELNAAANKLIEMAKKGGAEQNFLFCTNFDKYLEQQAIMADLQSRMMQIREQLKIDGLPQSVRDSLDDRFMDIAKEYRQQTSASNGTAQMLIKIIITFAEGSVMHDGEDEALDL